MQTDTFWLCNVQKKDVILENIFICVSAIILCPTSVRIAVCQYVEIPFIKSVIIIAIGMIVNICVFLSKKIILIAGSKRYAIEEVLPATATESNKAMIIFFKCFFVFIINVNI